jgi:RimJ/RimL family protein N-acetyltransferase
MEIRSARTVIRPWRRGDDQRADQWPPYNDPLDVLWNLPRPFNAQNIWSGGFDLPFERESWGVENVLGQLIGRISLREIERGRGQSRLGVTFGAPYVGQGLGTEALARFLDHYFFAMDFSAMVLDVAAPNLRAVRCYRRLGFRYVGSDWRQASTSFDRHVLERPCYAELLRFFQLERQRVAVEFYEMRLERQHWLARHPRQYAAS